jgi:hypothetical protein
VPSPMDDDVWGGSELFKSEFITEFCTLCMCETDHVKLSYADKVVVTCQHCQDSYEIKEEEEMVETDLVYTIASVEEVDVSTARRLNIVEVIKTIVPKQGNMHVRRETMMLQYPAYGVGKTVTHYPSSLETSEGTNLNHKEHEIIVAQLKTFMGIK